MPYNLPSSHVVVALVFAANYERSPLAIGKLILTKFGNSTLILSLKWPYGHMALAMAIALALSQVLAIVKALALPLALPIAIAIAIAMARFLALPWWC